MPIYEFVCEKCGHEFERLVASMNDHSLPECPKCQGSTKKRLSVFAAHSAGSRSACGDSVDNCRMASDGGCPGGSCPFAK